MDNQDIYMTKKDLYKILYKIPSEVVNLIVDFAFLTCCATIKSTEIIVCGNFICHNDITKEGYCSDECKALDWRNTLLEFSKYNIRSLISIPDCLPHEEYDFRYLLETAEYKGDYFYCPFCESYINELKRDIIQSLTNQMFLHLYFHFSGDCMNNDTILESKICMKFLNFDEKEYQLILS